MLRHIHALGRGRTLPEFDALLLKTVRSTYPAHEQERFAAHFRGLVGQWVREQGAGEGQLRH